MTRDKKIRPAPLLSERWDAMTEQERVDLMRQLFAPLHGQHVGFKSEGASYDRT